MDSQIKVSAFQDDSLGNYDAYDISEKIKNSIESSIKKLVQPNLFHRH